MKIVVLDGHTLNPGDLSWENLAALGDLTVHDRTPESEIISRAKGADAVFTNKTPLTRTTLQQLPGLQYIGVLATGFNVVDIQAARELGVPVTNIPAYGTESVAQMVFAHILNFALRVADHAHSVRDGDWSVSDDFCYWKFPLIELQGSTMGIVGFGRIGRATAKLALAFGMKVLVVDKHPERGHPEGITHGDLDQVFKGADFVSLHCPLSPENHHLVNARRLAMMKPSAFLVNTSRGPLVDEAALAEALKSGTIAGAGLDVLGAEPPAADNPLSTLENCFITPHISWATHSARSRLMKTAVENLGAHLSGQPKNVVNS